MKNNAIHEGPVRRGGLSGNNSTVKPDITPAGQGIILPEGNKVSIDIGNVFTQIRNARIALYSGDKGSTMAALKKAEKILVEFYGKHDN